MDIFIQIRNFFISNFSVTIKSLQIKKTIIKYRFLFILLKIFPFYFLKFLFNLLNIKCIYLMDNLYFSNYLSDITITPVLMTIESDNNINLMDNIKKYNFNIPIWFFLENENLNTINSIRLRYFHKGKMNTKDYSLYSPEDKLLSDLMT